MYGRLRVGKPTHYITHRKSQTTPPPPRISRDPPVGFRSDTVMSLKDNHIWNSSGIVLKRFTNMLLEYINDMACVQNNAAKSVLYMLMVGPENNISSPTLLTL